jgi:inosine/xanthosine triphosphate pyrophosphatase family protein
VGTTLLSAALDIFFAAVPALLTVTVQTNDSHENHHVIRIYKQLGFKHCCWVKYHNKVDSLMELHRLQWAADRESHRLSGGINSEALRAYVRVGVISLSNYDGKMPAPVVYLGSGSKEKREQYAMLFRQYGLLLRSLPTSISLPEPQIDGSGTAVESELVAFPLRASSRFIASSNSYPVVIDDTMLFVEAFNRSYSNCRLLPGPDTKRWWAALGADGLLGLLGNSSRRSAHYVCQLGVHYAPGEYESFRYELPGRISYEARSTRDAIDQFPRSNATFFHVLFIPDGSERTLGEMEPEEFIRYDYRRHCLAKAAASIRSRMNDTRQLDLFQLL